MLSFAIRSHEEVEKQSGPRFSEADLDGGEENRNLIEFEEMLMIENRSI